MPELNIKFKGEKIMLEKIKEIIAEELGVEESKVVEGASFYDDLGADSLDLFDMVMSFEDQFGVKIPEEELENIKTVGDAVKYIEEHK